MSSRNWLFRIQDILDSACTIREYTQGLTFETFCQNKMLVQSVLYNYIIGDALVKLRQENDLGEIDIEPEILAQLRDRSAGREVI